MPYMSVIFIWNEWPYSLTDASWRLKLKTKKPTLPRPFKYISKHNPLSAFLYLVLHCSLICYYFCDIPLYCQRAEFQR